MRLPSNLKTTTRNCVYFLMRGQWSLPVIRQRWRHTIRSTIVENNSWNKDFRTLLLLWPRPWPDELHIQTQLVFPRDIPDVRI